MPKQKFWPVSLLIFTLLFYPLLTTYFSMDDFYHFTVFPVSGNWGEFLKIFGIYKFSERAIAFYRPISRELPFFVGFHLFGLNPLPFRMFQIAVHLLNGYLVYKLIYKLTKQKLVSKLTSLFFLTSTINTAVLYYLAGGVQSSLMTTFLLLSCLNYLQFLNKNQQKYIYKTYLFNILALMSFETAVALPFLLAGLAILKNKYHSHKQNLIKNLLPSFLLSITFFLINYFYIGFSATETQYTLNLSPIKAVNTLVWYILWSFGLPEMLIDFVGPGLHPNPNLMAFWGRYFVIIFPVFFLLLSLTVYFILCATKKLKLPDFKLLAFFIFWFIALLGPFLFLPAHKSTHYLAPALPFFWAAILILINKSKAKWLFIIAVLTLNTASIKLGEKTYWAVQRGQLAQKILMQLKSEYPALPSGATLYIKNDPNYPKLKGDWGGSSTQVNYVLSGTDAVHLLYHDNSIEVFYEDLNPEPPNKNTINFTAKLK